MEKVEGEKEVEDEADEGEEEKGIKYIMKYFESYIKGGKPENE